MDEIYFIKRMEKINAKMTENSIDVFMIGPSSNLFYLTGYGVGPDERLFLFIMSKTGEQFILANVLYREQVKILPVKDQVYWKDGEDPLKLLKTEIEKRNITIKTAALETQIPVLFSLPLSQTFPDTRFVLGSVLTDPLRLLKDTEEIEMIRHACRSSDKALAAAIDKGSYWIGKTETEFSQALGAEFNKGELFSFGASVQAGPNAAIPHYSTGNALIKKGNCLLVDFWGRYNGYFTDCTRTFHFGKPDSEFEKIYAIVLEAYLAAESKARAGNTLADVDLAARSAIEKYGYGEYFTHRTGHGLGIDVHECISVNKGENIIIKPGMVFSIEPGIYIPGRFGVRIENLVAIGENGTEILHNYPRELRIIEE
jgi:Xaa-Pro dipeptidase